MEKFFLKASEGCCDISTAIYGWVNGASNRESPGGTDEWINELSFVPLGLKRALVTRNPSDKSPGYFHTVPTGRTADPLFDWGSRTPDWEFSRPYQPVEKL